MSTAFAFRPRSAWSLEGTGVTVAAAVLGVGALAALACTIGADTRWLAAVGRYIQATGRLPTAVPYATAPSAHWADASAVAQLIFHWLTGAFGDRGLMAAQLLAVGVGLTLLARDAVAGGAGGAGTAVALGLAAVGALPSLAIIRAQLFSLALFPALLLVLRAETRRPSRRIWLCVPLIALWSNLHGAALVGLGIALLYLALDRLRRQRWTAIAVGISSLLAICLTPAAWRTIAYYHGVLTNVAAQRGAGLWAHLSINAPFDVVLVVVALMLFGTALRGRERRPAVWELACVLALAVLTVRAARSGVWLLFFLVGPAARGVAIRHARRSISVSIACVACAVVILAIARGPLPGGADRTLVSRAIAIAHRTPILAPDIIAEQVVSAGGRVWLANPIDAFTKAAQATYLDWLRGAGAGRAALAPPVNVVLVHRASAADRLMEGMPRFALVSAAGQVRLYVRQPPVPGPANPNKR